MVYAMLVLAFIGGAAGTFLIYLDKIKRLDQLLRETEALKHELTIVSEFLKLQARAEMSSQEKEI